MSIDTFLNQYHEILYKNIVSKALPQKSLYPKQILTEMRFSWINKEWHKYKQAKIKFQKSKVLLTRLFH